MFVLGLLLLLIAAGLLLVAVIGGADDRAELNMGSLALEVNTAVVFLTGALTLVLLMLGLVLIRSAARRATQRRREAKELSRLSAKLEAQEAERREDAERSEEDENR